MKMVSLLLITLSMLGGLGAPGGDSIPNKMDLNFLVDPHNTPVPPAPPSTYTMRVVESVFIEINDNAWLDVSKETRSKHIQLPRRVGKVAQHKGYVKVSFGRLIKAALRNMQMLTPELWRIFMVMEMVGLVRTLCSHQFILHVDHAYLKNEETGERYVSQCTQKITIQKVVPGMILLPFSECTTHLDRKFSRHVMPLIYGLGQHTKQFDCAQLSIDSADNITPYDPDWYHIHRIQLEFATPASLFLAKLRVKIMELSRDTKTAEILQNIYAVCMADPVIQKHLIDLKTIDCLRKI